MDEFVAMVKKDYGLQGVSLWCSLAGVPPTFVDALGSPAAQVLTKDGVKDEYLLCHPSTAFRFAERCAATASASRTCALGSSAGVEDEHIGHPASRLAQDPALWYFYWRAVGEGARSPAAVEGT
jgi:hypothetical protein